MNGALCDIRLTLEVTCNKVYLDVSIHVGASSRLCGLYQDHLEVKSHPQWA